MNPVVDVRPVDVRRVVLVVLDGLRPDAIHAFGLDHIAHLGATSASTYAARTIAPSVTAAAMATLLTGVTPERHGVMTDRFHVPRRRASVDPLPRVLAAAGFPTDVFIGQLPWLYRGLATRIARYLGVRTPCSSGRGARDIVRAAEATLAKGEDGLIMLHWPDADRAGHAHGWMSPAYAAGARALDAALGDLLPLLHLDDAETMLIALADHGGGGDVATDHESEHPADRTIPIILSGGGLRPGDLLEPATLVDVPTTILDALGVTKPATYEGRSLFAAERAAIAAA